jgi:hypothetical protein
VNGGAGTQDASPWEAAGRAAAALADDASAIVVVGALPEAAAEAALGIGREQARRRRVAVVDLVGDVGPLRALVPEEDPHGVVDSFTYGVSLNRIARQVDEIGNLYVMPSGTEPLEHAEILRSDRWRRLTSGFREVGALLLLVVPSNADGLDVLLASSDGAVVVGPDARVLPAGANVLGTLGATRATRPLPPPVEPDEAVADLRARRSAAAPVAPTRRPPWLIPLAAGLVALAAVAAGLWFASRAEPVTMSGALARDTVPAAPAAPPTPRDTAPMIAVTNPGDSAAAVAWTVEIIKANTEAGATLKVRDDLADTPGATWSPVVLAGDSVRWYRVTAGAFAAREGADSLLRSLRARGLVAAGGGDVIRAPFSLVLEPALARDSARAVVARWAARGVDALAMERDAGTVDVVAGVFETPEQAAILATSLQAAGIAPAVVYRTGRVF